VDKLLNTPVVLWSIVGGLGVAILFASGKVVGQMLTLARSSDEYRNPWERL
jgi:flagellar biosynthesis protein FliQ